MTHRFQYEHLSTTLCSLVLAAGLLGCGDDDRSDASADVTDDGASVDAETMDAAPWDAGPSIEDCSGGLQADGRFRICVKFPSGVRSYDVPVFEDSFGTEAPPSSTEFADGYEPAEGECSVATHDRYWVRAQDGRVYRTWHPASTVDVLTNEPCTFGHEHGDDPRTSPLYEWAGGVPFGIANHAASVGNANHQRHEDHYGHKVVVQNDWQAVIGNPPDREEIKPTGFHCYWLSKVHQGTHSGDALGNNEHEYQNNIMCDDGAMRVEPDFEVNTGPNHHTEASVKTLTVWGEPGEFKACAGLDVTQHPGNGRASPDDSDTNREIKCAELSSGWVYKDRPQQITSETGHPDYSGSGIDELWKPWSTIEDRTGSRLFLSSAYYVVRNPARLYNPEGGLIPRRDMNGDGAVDAWIPTLDFCLLNTDQNACKDLPEFPADLDQTDWWKHPLSPFNGTVRVIHPKRIGMYNKSDRVHFCTDYRGVESDVDPTLDEAGTPRCPEGTIYQYIAATENMWFGRTKWGPDRHEGGISGSDINSHENGTIGSGYGHEWVRFFQAEGVHAPN